MSLLLVEKCELAGNYSVFNVLLLLVGHQEWHAACKKASLQQFPKVLLGKPGVPRLANGVYAKSVC